MVTHKYSPYGEWRYTYGAQHELVQATGPDGVVIDYDHDGSGKRIAKRIGGRLVREYAWLDALRLRACANHETGQRLLFLYDGDHDRLPFAVTDGQETYSLHYDQVGSLRVVADEAGQVIKTIQYDAFGNRLFDSTPDFWLPLGFAGGLCDSHTGLIRFGLRDYDPEVARFTAKDPLGDAGGDVDHYGYCLDDPVNRIDPTGLWSIWGGLKDVQPIWRWKAKPGACEVCSAKHGEWYDTEPEPAHPNCQCEFIECQKGFIYGEWEKVAGSEGAPRCELKSPALDLGVKIAIWWKKTPIKERRTIKEVIRCESGDDIVRSETTEKRNSEEVVILRSTLHCFNAGGRIDAYDYCLTTNPCTGETVKISVR